MLVFNVKSPAISELSEMAARSPQMDFSQSLLHAYCDLIPAVRLARQIPPQPKGPKQEGPRDA
ncbi:hypothetical protein SAMN04487859_12334 [Roseovarius lutimaris]|uniref:Uncharacterized protein n=1 Tax=Roseovarius lutimaris TaxID=1005928 RepID=A0A1I5FZ68_9RHOB|nr:hypothetical protein [Roseovarius lutimaris]SFO29074.1 hypothetical protein SAMN04487859_12334 [Roseovarius lutimaris]